MRDIAQLCWLFALVGGCNTRVPLGDLGGSGSGSLGDDGNGGAIFFGKGGSAGRQLGGGGGGNDGKGGVSLAPPGNGPEFESGQAGTTCVGPTLDIQATCPDDLPSPGSPCDTFVENGICTWQLQTDTGHEYVAEGCYAWPGGKFWTVWRFEVPPSSLVNRYSTCPKTPPRDGSSRITADDVECLYPFSSCKTAVALESGERIWSCGSPASSPGGLPPLAAYRSCFPPDVDESKQVIELNELEAISWCVWSHSASPRRGKSALFAANYYQVLGQGPTPATPLCMAALTTADCVNNLRSRPCTATLAEVDDCVATIELDNLPGDQKYWFGHGCAPLLENPTCTGVVVQPWLIDEPDETLQCVPRLQ